MSDGGPAVQRAQNKTEQLQARAGALDEPLASGALEDATVLVPPMAGPSALDGHRALPAGIGAGLLFLPGHQGAQG